MIELEQKLETAKKSFRAKLMFSVLGGILLFAIALPLAYFAHSVSFRIAPRLAANNASVSVSDGVGLVLFGRAYILGGQAALRFESPGFISQAVGLDFQKGAKHLIVEMQEAPVSVVITTDPPLPQTRWRVNGVYAATAERFAQELQPGTLDIEVDNEFYQPEVLQIEVQTGKDFTHHLNLTPITGNLSITSDPAGAQVVINGEKKGVTPIQISAVSGGLYRTQVILDGYETVEEEIAIINRLMEIKRGLPTQIEPSRSANQRIACRRRFAGQWRGNKRGLLAVAGCG